MNASNAPRRQRTGTLRSSRAANWLWNRRLWIGGALALALILSAGVGVLARKGDLTIAGADEPPPFDGSCEVDNQGANDEPGQKDLTRMCVNYEYAEGQERVLWQWDEIKWTGANTGDACSLYDTDDPVDGYANYALCVTVSGDPATQLVGSPAYSPRLYECNNTSAYKCMGSNLLLDNRLLASTCVVTQEDWDPFPAGAAYPQDTVADCIVDISEVGGGRCSSPARRLLLPVPAAQLRSVRLH
jgi:hypothetical protein